MKHRGWISISGFVWLAIGVFLLSKGLRLISEATHQSDTLCSSFQHIFGTPQQSGTALIAGGLLVGFFKGRFILSKTVKRVVHRILSLPLPIQLRLVYAPSYWIIIGLMMSLGMVFRFLSIPIDLRGFIDVSVGSALMNGAMLYFRAARNVEPV